MEAAMSNYELSNAEAYNRWKFAQKQTAKSYWYDFLLNRAKHGNKKAQGWVDMMDAVGNK